MDSENPIAGVHSNLGFFWCREPELEAVCEQMSRLGQTASGAADLVHESEPYSLFASVIREDNLLACNRSTDGMASW